MASIRKVQNGETCRPKVTWTNWATDGTGEVADPDSQSTTFTVYDNATMVQVATGAATRESIGVYYYDWTVPASDDPQTFLIEFTANFAAKPQKATQRVVGRRV